MTRFLENIDDINCVNSDRYTLLAYACCRQDRFALRIVKMLLHRGADTNFQTVNGKPIHIACLSRNEDVAIHLLPLTKNRTQLSGFSQNNLLHLSYLYNLPKFRRCIGNSINPKEPNGYGHNCKTLKKMYPWKSSNIFSKLNYKFIS